MVRCDCAVPWFVREAVELNALTRLLLSCRSDGFWPRSMPYMSARFGEATWALLRRLWSRCAGHLVRLWLLIELVILARQAVLAPAVMVRASMLARWLASIKESLLDPLLRPLMPNAPNSSPLCRPSSRPACPLVFAAGVAAV